MEDEHMVQALPSEAAYELLTIGAYLRYVSFWSFERSVLQPDQGSPEQSANQFYSERISSKVTPKG